MVLEFKGRVDEHELMKWARGKKVSPEGSSSVVLDVQVRRLWGRDKILASSVLHMKILGETVLATKRLA